jgi:hypothetical protein
VNSTLGRPYLRALLVLVSVFVLLHSALAGPQSGIGVTIQIQEGNNVQNVVDKDAPKPIVVRVMDRTGRPLPEATVLFSAPETGPGGNFASESNPVIVFTDQQGVATAPQYHANSMEGSYRIQVQASYMGESSTTPITQTNIAQKKSSKKLLIFTAVAGGAAAAALGAMKGGGSGGGSSTPSTPSNPGSSTPPTITFGGTTIGAPQ